MEKNIYDNKQFNIGQVWFTPTSLTACIYLTMWWQTPSSATEHVFSNASPSWPWCASTYFYLFCGSCTFNFSQISARMKHEDIWFFVYFWSFLIIIMKQIAFNCDTFRCSRPWWPSLFNIWHTFYDLAHSSQVLLHAYQACQILSRAQEWWLGAPWMACSASLCLVTHWWPLLADWRNSTASCQCSICSLFLFWKCLSGNNHAI